MQSEDYSIIEARIEEAIDEMKNEKKTNIAALARKYALPEQRLRARLKGRISRKQRESPNRKLTADQELGLCQYLDRLDELGIPPRYRHISSYANSILLGVHTDTAEPPPTVGPAWTQHFLQRHPEYHVRKQKTLDVERKQSHDPEVLQNWFRRYQAIVEEKGIQRADIYNFDETGFRIGIGRDQWVVTREAKRPLTLGSSSNRESVTVIEAISGDGGVLPPMIILPGALHMEDWYTKTAIPDTFLIGVSDTGYSNDNLALKWLSHFEAFSAKRQVGSWRLLILDGHDSHSTREFITFCDEHRIILFCLPSHCTHLLQPLDVVVFQPYKHYHGEAVDAATRTGCSQFDKTEFFTAIESIRTQTFKPTTILSAFRKTGLWPFNPDMVLDKLQPIPAPARRPSTPIPGPQVDSSPTTPKTLRSLKQHADSLAFDLNEIPPSSYLHLQKYLKGSLAFAQSGALALQHLEDTKAAELARPARQKRNRRSLQKGGVLYAYEAREMVKQKEKDTVEKELEKAQRAFDHAQNTVEKKVTKQWKEISKQMRKAVRDRTRKRRFRGILGREIRPRIVNHPLVSKSFR